MQSVADLVTQLEQFMLSPGFTGALKSFSEADGAEPDAVLHIANRLMDYHESFLTEAERCLQTPVETDVIVFVQDMAAFTMCPLAGYEQFIQRCAAGSPRARRSSPMPTTPSSSTT